jgi:hypothetical protein
LKSLVMDRQGFFARYGSAPSSSRVGKFHERDALLDFQHTGEYAETLHAAGIGDVRVSKLSFWMFPPVRKVTAVKP